MKVNFVARDKFQVIDYFNLDSTNYPCIISIDMDEKHVKEYLEKYEGDED